MKDIKITEKAKLYLDEIVRIKKPDLGSQQVITEKIFEKEFKRLSKKHESNNC